MKRFTLLFLMAVSLFSIAKAQITLPFLHPADKKLVPHSTVAAERSDFPELLLDSSAVEYWTDLTGTYELVYTQNLKLFRDLSEKVIAERSNDVNYYNGQIIISNEEGTYIYDQNNRLKVYESFNTDELGAYSYGSKDEYTYSGSGTDNYTEVSWGKYDPAGDWKPKYRQIRQVADTVDTTLFDVWDDIIEDFTPTNRAVRVNSSEGLILSTQSEFWQDTGWIVTNLDNLTYDADGNLLTDIRSSGDMFNALHFVTKIENDYDATGRNTVTRNYEWDAFSSDWVLISQIENVFNNQDEKVESYVTTPGLSGGLEKAQHISYVYGPGIYTDIPESTLRRNWDPGTQTYLDVFRDLNIYSDLPDGQVMLEIDNSDKPVPGQGEWRRGLFIRDFYNKSQSSGIPDNPVNQFCAVPNPYTAGFRVQCDQLKTDASYMLWVYDLNGKEVYARHFKGGEGWSIDRELRQGVYAAVVTHNKQRIASYKIISGK